MRVAVLLPPLTHNHAVPLKAVVNHLGAGGIAHMLILGDDSEEGGCLLRATREADYGASAATAAEHSWAVAHLDSGVLVSGHAQSIA
jgi:hypothetical protein